MGPVWSDPCPFGEGRQDPLRGGGRGTYRPPSLSPLRDLRDGNPAARAQIVGRARLAAFYAQHVRGEAGGLPLFPLAGYDRVDAGKGEPDRRRDFRQREPVFS